MRYTLKLNSQDNSITLKRVSRSIVLRQTGRSGPQGPAGATGPQGPPGTPGATEWGQLTGNISDQTDLQAALNTKEPTITAGDTTQYWRGDKTWQTLNKTAVGLPNVDNTSDLNKPISTATQAALDLKATPANITAAIDSLVDAAPGTLDTLNELAASLGDDPNFATTVTNSIAGKLAIASNLSDLANAATARTNLGLGTTDSPTFGGLTLSGGALGITSPNLLAVTTNVGGTGHNMTITEASGDSSLYLSTSGASKASYLSLNSTNSSFGAFRGYVNGTQVWAAGRFGHGGFNIYTNGSTRAASWDTSQNTIFYGTLGLAGATATHTLTLPSTSTGIALHNTSDQTTNNEHGFIGYESNTFNIKSRASGTGTIRNLSIGTNAQSLTFRNSANTNGFYLFDASSAATSATAIRVSGTWSASSNAQYGVYIGRTINQSGTAGYTELLINPTETATGSGNKYLIEGQVGGAQRFVVSNNGRIYNGDSLSSTRLSSGNGPRSLNMIDTAAVARIWRYNTTLDPALELIGGTNDDAANAANVWWDLAVGAPSSISLTADTLAIRRRSGGSTSVVATYSASAFTLSSGVALRINQAPVAETPTPTHTVTINLNGTDYKIPVVAA